MGRILAIVCALALLPGCGVPRDPESTLERARGGTIRVGITENEPWTVLEGDEPAGIEVELVQDLAGTLDADIEWFPGSAEDLAAAVHMRELDLLIGGFASTSSLAGEVTFTHPYITTQVVVAAPAGEAPPEDIAGLEVAVEAGTEEAGILAKTDAIPQRVTEPLDTTGLKVVHDWEMTALGLADTGVRLLETDHVMGVPHGENAWLTELERFLLAREDAVRQMLEESAR